MKTVETEEKDDYTALKWIFLQYFVDVLSTQQHFLKSDHSLNNNIL